MRMDDTEGAYCRCRGTYSESSTSTATAPDLVEWQFITAEQSKLGVSPTSRISELKRIPVPRSGRRRLLVEGSGLGDGRPLPDRAGAGCSRHSDQHW